MARTVALDQQYFGKIRENEYFYVDKTAFIRKWWKAGDTVTLITRPRRFGKTLMMSTVEHFFSMKHAGRSDLFEGLDVWKDEDLRALQGTYPVIFLSLADVKPGTFEKAQYSFCLQIRKVFRQWSSLSSSSKLEEYDRREFTELRDFLTPDAAVESLNRLCEFIMKATGKKSIILLDEYDTPMQEAWVKGFWPEMAEFMRGFFNATFKTNPFLERALLTGITRISRESLFSDFNNLKVVSTTTPRYETAFGFTEEEVFAAMDEFGYADRAGVKAMYDGFTFGGVSGIYNPWSVIRYLQEGTLEPWWANTSSNALVGKLVREGGVSLKRDFMDLLEGKTIISKIEEQIVYDLIDGSPEAVWSLLMAAGYLKPVGRNGRMYELALTNGEVRRIFEDLVENWFKGTESYGGFLEALREGNLKYMNEYMNDVSLSCFSSFDTGGTSAKRNPERFYHGFVLGLLVDLRDRYVLTSNRESGLGRYDVMLEPRDPARDDAFIFEFKVHDSDDESDLKATVAAALEQIKARHYAQQLIERGIPENRIRKYGFAFRGREVLIGQA